jgi:4-hydroxybenzoate polyprenyltransferase
MGSAATGSVPSGLGGLGFVRFRYHVTFVNVVFGALIFAGRIDGALVWQLVALYVSFNILLYSGLYAINDIADREADARHPGKRGRPIPSARVSIGAARLWVAGYVVAGLVSGALLFGRDVFYCYVVIVLINLAYSGGGRNIVYLDVLLNGLPHVVRFAMGALVVGRMPPVTHLFALLLLSIAISALRRRLERDLPGWEARRTLTMWSVAQLDGVIAATSAGILAMTAVWASAAPGFYAAVLSTTVIVVGGAYLSSGVRGILRWVWSH